MTMEIHFQFRSYLIKNFHGNIIVTYHKKVKNKNLIIKYLNYN